MYIIAKKPLYLYKQDSHQCAFHWLSVLQTCQLAINHPLAQETLKTENLNRAVLEIQNCDYEILTDFGNNESQSDRIWDEPPLSGGRDK